MTPENLKTAYQITSWNFSTSAELFSYYVSVLFLTLKFETYKADILDSNFLDIQDFWLFFF